MTRFRNLDERLADEIRHRFPYVDDATILERLERVLADCPAWDPQEGDPVSWEPSGQWRGNGREFGTFVRHWDESDVGADTWESRPGDPHCLVDFGDNYDVPQWIPLHRLQDERTPEATQ